MVLHVFSGSKDALAKNTGGVETFLNNMIKNNMRSDISSLVVGRQYQFIPQIITEVKREEVGQIPRQRIVFPYLTYLLSNLILGVSLSFRLLVYNGGKNKTTQRLVIHVHDPVIGATLFLFFPRFLRSATYVSQFHSDYSKRLEIMLSHALLSRLTLRLYSSLEKICIWRADVAIPVSEHIRSYLIAAGCSSAKIQKIPIFLETIDKLNSVPVSRSVMSLGIEKNQFILTYIGRLSKEKNLPILLSAFSLLDPSIRKNLTLLIAGAGDQLNKIKPLITPKISDRVRLLGHRSDIGFILSNSDVFILPSLTEGFPFSLLEAMAHGKAIIASNIPPIAEIVENGQDALLFDPTNPKQLSSVITKLYADSDLRIKLGLNARAKAKLYDRDIVIPMLINTYYKYVARQ
jgi:glycosyltransferase involved in cell wall biosynthesis